MAIWIHDWSGWALHVSDKELRAGGPRPKDYWKLVRLSWKAHISANQSGMMLAPLPEWKYKCGHNKPVQESNCPICDAEIEGNY